MAIHACKNEHRIAQLEGDIRVHNISIDNLIKKIDSLTSEVKWLIRLGFTTLITIVLAMAGYVFSIIKG